MLAQQDASAGLAGPDQMAVMTINDAAEDIAATTDVADIAPPAEPKPEEEADAAQDDDEAESDEAESDAASDADADADDDDAASDAASDAEVDSASDAEADADSDDGEMPPPPKDGDRPPPQQEGDDDSENVPPPQDSEDVPPPQGEGDDVPPPRDSEEASTDDASDDAQAPPPKDGNPPSETEGQEGRELQEAAQQSSGTYDSTKTDECCADANPLVDQQIALVVLILNILMPGIGSIVAAYMDPNGCNCKCATFGILQGILAVVLAGWIWSIVQGVLIYQKSQDYYENGPGASSSSSSQESAAN